MHFLEKQPYNCSKDRIEQLHIQIKNMTTDEKIKQLFIHLIMPQSVEQLTYFINTYKPGGIMLTKADATYQAELITAAQEATKIPLFIASNLETGDQDYINQGINIVNPMQIAATQNPENAFLLGKMAASEVSKIGLNLAFSPVADINLNWQNPITNIRSYGDNVELIKKCVIQAKSGYESMGVLSTLKHFPGDGVDMLDHHVVGSTNKLSKAEWDTTFGQIYKEAIKENCSVIMAGHIAFPGYFSANDVEKYKVATQSAGLLKGLLREELGYNGLIITDSTFMAGFASQGTRKQTLIETINAGCDMILFSRNILDDMKFMQEAVDEQKISMLRIEEAILRILATKELVSQIQQHQKASTKAEIDSFQQSVIDNSITLVKNGENLIPCMDKKKYGYIYLRSSTNSSIDMLKNGANKSFMDYFIIEMMEQQPDISIEPVFSESISEQMKVAFLSIEDLKAKFDMIIYIVEQYPISTQTTMRPTYQALGFDAPWFVKEIPTILISAGNPYQNIDFPMIETVVSTYQNDAIVIKKLVEKLIGKSEFKGVSPIQLTKKD